jgi:Zn-dependent protease
MDIGSRVLTQLASLIAVFLAAIIVITIHEFAHAFTSWRLGDKLPRFNKRLTLNPAWHIDIAGLIFMVSTGYISSVSSGFGWGNHVETSPKYYKDKQRGTILVGLAGPLASLILGILAMIPLAVLEQMSAAQRLQLPQLTAESLEYFLKYIIVFSFNLAFISLLPFNPFDGFMIWGKLIKPKTQFAILQYQSIIFTVFLFVILIVPGVFQTLINPVINIFQWSISNIVNLIL